MKEFLKIKLHKILIQIIQKEKNNSCPCLIQLKKSKDINLLTSNFKL
jgi:hypothetical protein